MVWVWKFCIQYTQPRAICTRLCGDEHEENIIPEVMVYIHDRGRFGNSYRHRNLSHHTVQLISYNNIALQCVRTRIERSGGGGRNKCQPQLPSTFDHNKTQPSVSFQQQLVLVFLLAHSNYSNLQYLAVLQTFSFFFFQKIPSSSNGQ